MKNTFLNLLVAGVFLTLLSIAPVKATNDVEYQLSSPAINVAWIMNSATGQVRLCDVRLGGSLPQKKPICTMWSDI